MSSRTGKALAIKAAANSSTLSKHQKTFNRQIKQIEQQRQRLAEWEAVDAPYRKRHTEEKQPLEKQLHDLREALVRRLDLACQEKALTSKERATASEIIVGTLSQLDRLLESDELKAIYNRHSDTDFDSAMADDAAMTREMVKEMTGFDLGDDVDVTSPEELLRHLAEKAGEASARDEARRARRKKSAKQQAREAEREAKDKDVSEVLREVYRKLASALHPDREPDETERARKSALMQRANMAYDSRNLLQLLELQLELEHIDPASLAQLSEDKLRHYNRILKEQSQELDLELIRVQHQFLMRYRVEPDPFRPLTPNSVMVDLVMEIEGHRQHVADAERDVAALGDINGVKAFLKAMRGELKLMKQQARMMDMFEDDLPF